MKSKTSHSKNCLEVGALTGYNAVTMAMATPSDGKVITVDLTENNMTPLKNIWKEAGVEHKVFNKKFVKMRLIN